MADINSILSDLGEAVAADGTIETWAQAAYSQSVTVLENCDPRNEPEQGDCPLVILYPVAKTGGLAQGVKVHVIGISCAVFDAAKPISTQGVLRFTGGRLVEELRALVVDVIQDNIAADVHIEAVVTEYNTIEQFPFVSANMDLTLTQEKLIGGDALE